MSPQVQVEDGRLTHDGLNARLIQRDLFNHDLVNRDWATLLHDQRRASVSSFTRCEARRLGVTRQSIIKVWIAERLGREAS